MRFFGYSLAATLLAETLTSCAAPRYQAPSEGPTARLRIVSKYVKAHLFGYGDAGCQTDKTRWFPLPGKQVTLDMPLGPTAPDQQNQEMLVSADHDVNGFFVGETTDFHGVYIGGSRIAFCAIPFTYRFSENRDYELVFTQIHLNCNVVINQIDADGNGEFKRTLLQKFDMTPGPSYESCLKQWK